MADVIQLPAESLDDRPPEKSTSSSPPRSSSQPPPQQQEQQQEQKQLSDGANHEEVMYDAFGGKGVRVPSFSSDINPPPVLMPVPGAGPLGPFVPAPPDVAMQMFSDPNGGPPPFEGGNRGGRSAPLLGGPGPFLLSPAFRQDPRRSYQDLDAAEEEVTVIDYRCLWRK